MVTLNTARAFFEQRQEVTKAQPDSERHTPQRTLLIYNVIRSRHNYQLPISIRCLYQLTISSRSSRSSSVGQSGPLGSGGAATSILFQVRSPLAETPELGSRSMTFPIFFPFGPIASICASQSVEAEGVGVAPYFSAATPSCL